MKYLPEQGKTIHHTNGENYGHWTSSARIRYMVKSNVILRKVWSDFRKKTFYLS